jgi:outer membrane autotransporter protein
MTTLKRLLVLLALGMGALQPLAAHAECGGSVQCISVGLTPGQANTNHHGGGSGTFIMAFGNQSVDSTAPSQTAYVAAVTGPAGTMANLGVISITGPDAASFLITGGSCSDANGPVHGGAQCTIVVAFNPVSTGSKSATVNVPLDPPLCAGCITGRDFTVSGIGVEPSTLITSPLTASGTTGGVFRYQITATNNPTSFGATDLPPGLSIDAAGLISGTPTTAGTFNTSITASNASGSDTRTLVITIAVGTPAPAVSSLNVTVPFETATPIDLASSVSGAYTSLAIASMPEHGLASLEGTVVTYTPAAGFVGEDRFTFTATGPGGTSSPAALSITVTAQPPSAGPATMTVQVNTPTTLDLRPFTAGSGITRVAVTLQPARGRVSVSGTRVTYTPNPDVFGNDSFAYVAIGGAGTSEPATVTVNIVGRPDPARDPVVTGMLQAQSTAAERFSAAQISNFQRRMESLHRGDPAAPGAMALAPAFASLAATGDVDLAALGIGGARGSREQANFWIAGTAQFGRRDADGSLAGLDFTTAGLSLGVDRRLGGRLVVGAGLGAARDKSRIGTEGSESEARGFSGAVYASFQPTRETFLDALLGVGKLDFESRRFIGAISETASADRDGSQVFGSVAAGYEHRRNGVVISPYGRLDWSRDKLDAATESGAAPYALAFSGQSATSLRGALGLRAETTVETRYGWTTPRLRVEYRRQLEGERTTSIAYADLIDGPRFSFSSEPDERNALLLGLGVDFIVRGGLTVGIDYQAQRASARETDQLVRLNISQELAGTGSLRWLDGLFLEATRPLDIQMDAGFTYDDNVTRALSEADKRADRSFGLNLRKSVVRFPGKNVRAIVTGSFGGERFQYHNGLSHLKAGLKAELQYRASAAFGSPTYAIFAQGATEQYESRLRDGERYLGGASVRVPVTDRVGVFGSLFHQRRNARSEVFDTRENGARVNIDWAVGPRSALYLSGEYRRGDLNTSADPIGQHVSKHDGPGAHQVVDDAFSNPQLTTARFEGKSWMATLGYNLALGPRDALDFSWRRVRSKPNDPRDVVIGFYEPTPPVRYTVNQFFILYLLSF